MIGIDDIILFLNINDDEEIYYFDDIIDIFYEIFSFIL